MRAEELLEMDQAENGKPAAGIKGNSHYRDCFQLPKILPDFWYRSPGNVWFARDSSGVYRDYPLSHVRAELLQGGLRGSVHQGESLSPLDRMLLAIRKENVVSWAGELAGFKLGVHQVCDEKILVTRSAKWIEPRKGEWETLRPFLAELLGDQVLWFYAWCKSALRALYAGPPFRRGQALALAGPVGCGKSLLQSIITELFGGRVARPFQYLMGDTAFNEDLLKAEHLMIEDEASSRDPRKRDYFGGQLKNLVANDVVRAHPKGAKALYLQSFNRVTITLNDQPENMSVLPLIRGDLADKITLLHAQPATFPYGPNSKRGREKFRLKLSDDLPAFLHFLTEWKIPASMVSQRYGCRSYQDPELLALLNDDQPEVHLLELIDRLKPWGVDSIPWEGSSAKLQNDLEEKDRHGRVSKLLSWHGACGQLLARLYKSFPSRVQKVNSKGHATLWRILP